MLTEHWPPAIHYMGAESVTAQAIYANQTVCAAGVSPGVRSGNPGARLFLESNAIRTYAITPIVIGGGVRGAISVYRTSDRQYFEQDLKRLKELGSVVPNLYTALIDRVGFQLLAKTHPLPQFPTTSEVALQPVVELVAATLNCMEVSIFLEDYLDDPGVNRLKACAWKWPENKPPLDSPVPEEGATRYVVEKRETIHILDIAHKEEVERQYPGLVWKDNLRVHEQAKRLLKTGPGGELQPLTFVATPIRGSDRLLGVIRCGVAQAAPFYFDTRCVQFIELLAERVGTWWETYLHQRQDVREVELWRRLADQVADMSSFVIEELARNPPDETRIFRRALDLVQEVFIDSFAYAVRLHDSVNNELYFAEVAGKVWEKYRSRIDDPRRQRYPLEGPPNSAGAWVWHTRDVYMTEDSPRDDLTVVIFPETTREIAAPIAGGEHMYGVLDIISASKRPFGPVGKPVAKLLGRQIGLYHHLALKIAEISAFQRDNVLRVEKESKTYENFEHQIRTPVMKALRRSTELVRDQRAQRHLDPKLLVLRSLCRQADRVARNLRFFAQIGEDRPATLLPDSLSTMTASALVEFLKEASEDQSRQVHSRKRLEFHVDDKSFEELYRVTVRVNWDLLEQAVGNLLDNAGKYSYPSSRIKVSGGVTRRGDFFYISVANRGYPLREPNKLTLRGYRGDEAQGSEGSGIGLWIVKHIMLAHKGHLEIIPTTEQGVNDFRLLFPKLRT